ncbi:MAG: PAS domain-containing protein [Opitutaceae bacterium]|nr:PAS domain-containing protein [Opitutaceae bacterium]
MLDVLLDLLIEFEPAGLTVLSIDPKGRALLGLADGPLNGLKMSALLSGESLTVLLYQVMPRLASGAPWRGDFDLLRGGASTLHVHAVFSASPATATTPFITLGAIDRTDVTHLLTALSHEQTLLSSLLASIPESVYFKDLHSRFLRVSTAMARKTKSTRPEDLIGLSDFDRFSEEHATQAYRDEQEIIRTGQGIIDFVEKETWPDGHVTWVSSTKLPLRDSSGRIIGTFGISRDITARKRAEEERQQLEIQLNLAQKMESIGRLAAGIAHEVNTPTQFINDNTHFLVDAMRQIGGVIAAYRALRSTAADHAPCQAAAEAARVAEEQGELDYFLEEIPRTLEQTLEGVARIAKIVRSLKEFSHPSSPEKTPADINHAIEVAVNVTRHEWKYVADIQTDLAPDLPQVPCILDEFNQVLLNLIVNAAHAIGDVVGDSGVKGRITLRTHMVGDFVRIDVQDTGTGIPPEAQPRIFQPFFTTKAMGKGTGQGLAMVQTIVVKKHQGRVSFTTEPGAGTTFHVDLPLVPAQIPPSP